MSSFIQVLYTYIRPAFKFALQPCTFLWQLHLLDNSECVRICVYRVATYNNMVLSSSSTWFSSIPKCPPLVGLCVFAVAEQDKENVSILRSHNVKLHLGRSSLVFQQQKNPESRVENSLSFRPLMMAYSLHLFFNNIEKLLLV